MVTYEQLVGLPKYAVDFGLPFTYIIFLVALLSVLGFALYQLVYLFIDSPKKALTVLGSVVGVIFIYLICYLMAKGEPFISGEDTISGGTMRFVEANLLMTYISFTIAVLAIVYSSVSQYFK